MIIQSFNLEDTAFVNLNYQDEVLFLQLNGNEVWSKIRKTEGLVYTGLDSSGEITTDESQIVSYMIGDGSEIDGNAYRGTETKIFIPETYNDKPVTKIGQYAFRNGAHISFVSLPETTTEISDRAFQWCFDLKNIALPEGLLKIGNEAFDDSGLITIAIPENVIEIGRGVFRYSSLTSAIIRSNVVGIEMFSRCKDLVTITINGNIPKIEQSMFNECSSLKSITIPESVTEIGSGAFSYTGLTSIIIPKNVSKIGTTAFYNSPIVNMTVLATTPPVLAYSNVISASTKTISVPEESFELYENAQYWSDYVNILRTLTGKRWNTVFTGSINLTRSMTTYADVSAPLTINSQYPVRVSGKAYFGSETFTNVKLSSTNTLVVKDTYDQYMRVEGSNLIANVKGALSARGITLQQVEQFN